MIIFNPIWSFIDEDESENPKVCLWESKIGGPTRANATVNYGPLKYKVNAILPNFHPYGVIMEECM